MVPPGATEVSRYQGFFLRGGRALRRYLRDPSVHVAPIDTPVGTFL